jgi:hypothetical protein
MSGKPSAAYDEFYERVFLKLMQEYESDCVNVNECNNISECIPRECPYYRKREEGLL